MILTELPHVIAHATELKRISCKPCNVSYSQAPTPNCSISLTQRNTPSNNIFHELVHNTPVSVESWVTMTSCNIWLSRKTASWRIGLASRARQLANVRPTVFMALLTNAAVAAPASNTSPRDQVTWTQIWVVGELYVVSAVAVVVDVVAD